MAKYGQNYGDAFRSGSSSKKSSSSSSTSSTENLNTRLQGVGMDTDTRNPLEKFLNLEEDQNFLFDILEIADRGGNAIRNMIAPEENDTDDFLTNAWQGLSGQEKTSGWDVTDRLLGATIDETSSTGEKIAYGLAGLGGEILLDPLNWVGIGLIDDAIDVGKAGSELVFGFNKGKDIFGTAVTTGAKKSASAIGSTVTKIAPDFAKASVETGTKFKDAFQSLGNTLISPISRLRGVDNQAVANLQQSLGLTKNATHNIVEMVNKSSTEFSSAIKPFMKDPEVTNDLIKYAQEEMPDLYSKIVDNKLTTQQFKEIADQIVLSASGNSTHTRNFEEMLSTLLRDGKVTVTASKGLVDEPMRKFYDTISNLIGGDMDDFVKIGTEFAPDDLRRISLTEDGLELLNQAIKDLTETNPNGLSDFLKNSTGEDILGTSFEAISQPSTLNLSNTLGGQRFLHATQPFSEQFNNITGYIQKSMADVGYDVDKISGYIKNQLTAEGRNAVDIARSGNKTVALSNNVNVAGGTKAGMQTIGKSNSQFINRSYFGNPVDTNKTLRELLGSDTPTFVTDGFSLLSNTAKSYIDEAYQQTMRTEIIEMLAKSVDNGIDNGMIASTKVNKVFDDVNALKHTRNSSKSAYTAYIKRHGDKISNTLLDTVGSNEITPDNISKAINTYTSRGVEVPVYLQNASERYATNQKAIADLYGTQRQVLETVGKTGLDSLTDTQMDSLFKAMSNSEIENYMKAKGITNNMKRYENIGDMLNKSQFSLSFGDDTGDLNSYINSLKKYVGNSPVYMDSTVANMLERSSSLGKQTSALMDLFTKYTNTWKASKLFNIGYPIRNLFGDTTNLIIGGMPVADTLEGAVKSMADINSLTKISSTMNENILKYGNAQVYHGLSESQIALAKEWDDFVKTGLNTNTRTTDEVKDIMTLLQGDSAKQGIYMFSNNLLKSGAEAVYNTSSFIDSANRFNAWRWASSPKGAEFLATNGYKSASDFVNTALFDYSDLSKFENDVMKKIFPFYTFMRKNTEYHIRNFSNNTRRYGQMKDMSTAFYESNGIDPSDMPNYITDNMQVPIGTNEDGTINYVKLTPSFVEAFNVINLQGLGTALHPIIKTPIEVGAGVNLFTGGEDTRTGPEQISSLLPYPQIAQPLVDELTIGAQNILSGNPSLLQQQIQDFPSRVPQMGIDSIVGSLIGNVNPEATQYFDNMDRYDHLSGLRSQYEDSTGQSLPTLDELGL